jgi:hypothetical protein
LGARSTLIRNGKATARVRGFRLKTVTGIFASQANAERAARAVTSTLGADRITLLMPGRPTETPQSLHSMPTGEAGMGKALGGVIGATIGVAGGVELAIYTAVLPGVGPVIALGLLGGALLGLAGAEACGALDKATTDGLPEDEFFLYEDALRRRRSVLIAYPDNEGTARLVREMLDREGAEPIDAARARWWNGLRSAEREHYSSAEEDFSRDEEFYRLGFEAALHARNRCKEYDQVLAEMEGHLKDLRRHYPGADVEKPFRRGFDRGRNYNQRLYDQSRQPANQ